MGMGQTLLPVPGLQEGASAISTLRGPHQGPSNGSKPLRILGQLTAWLVGHKPSATFVELLRGLTCAQLGTCHHEVYPLSSHSRDFLVWGRVPLLAQLRGPSEPSTGSAEGLVTSA